VSEAARYRGRGREQPSDLAIDDERDGDHRRRPGRGPPPGSEMLPAAARSRRSPSSSGIIAKAASAPTATRADSTVADSSRWYPSSVTAAAAGAGLAMVSGARIAAASAAVTPMASASSPAASLSPSGPLASPPPAPSRASRNQTALLARP